MAEMYHEPDPFPYSLGPFALTGKLHPRRVRSHARLAREQTSSAEVGRGFTKAVADAEKNSDDSDWLTAYQNKKLPFAENGSLLES
jgi:hypothetical protein